MTQHTHGAADECTPACAAYDPKAWRCQWCGRQRPMAADTEDWKSPQCDECYDTTLALAEAGFTIDGNV